MESLETRTLLAFGLPKAIGGDGFDMGKRIVATADGGYVEAGLFEGTVQFGTSSTTRLTALGDTDIFIAKYSASGALVWARRLGGIEMSDEISSADVIDVAADPERAGGEFINGVGAEPLRAAEYVTDLVVGPDSSIYLTGNFLGSVDFDPGSGSHVLTTFDNDFYDGFVLKLSGNGVFNFAKQLGGRFTDTISAMTLDPSGNLYLTGLFSRTVDFVPGNRKFLLIAEGRADGYVMKLSRTGAIQWIDQFGADATSEPERDAGLDIAIDSAGNLYVGGTYTGDATFTTTSGTPTVVDGRKRSDGFVAKYNNSGVLLKTALFNGRGFDGVSTLAVDANNNVIVAGYFQGDEFDADPGALTVFLPEPVDKDGDTTGLTDLFVEKLNSNLTMSWVREARGTGTELADQMAVDSGGNILIGGSFYGLCRFGFGPGRSGIGSHSIVGQDDFDDSNDHDRDDSYDAFVWKLRSSGTSEWVRRIGFSSDDFGAGIDVTADGSVLFTGRFRNVVDFDPGPTIRRFKAHGFADAFVTGYDNDGAVLF